MYKTRRLINKVILSKYNNNNNNNNIIRQYSNTNINSNNNNNSNNNRFNKFIKTTNESILIKNRNHINKNNVINDKINSNSSTDKLISNIVYVVDNEKEDITKIEEEQQTEEQTENNYLDKSRFELEIQIPKITLNSQYKKYALMIKNNINLEIIKKEAISDEILLSTSFYNTLIYVYLLKLTSGGSNGNNSQEEEEEERSRIEIIESIESIFKNIYKPDRITFLLKILSVIKKKKNDNNNIEELIEYCNELIKSPNSYLLCQDGFLMLIQEFYNCKKYDMVVKVYKEFVHHHSFLNETETWYTGIVVHSMYQERLGAIEIETLLNKSKLQYTKYTQFHFNCCANKHLEENGIIESWNILKQLYLLDLEYSITIPNGIIDLLKSTEQFELTIKMYPLLLMTIQNNENSKLKLKQLLLECGTLGKKLLSSDPSNSTFSSPLFNPLSDQYVFSKKSISSIIIDPTPSIMGIKIPVVPKHKRISRFERMYDKRLDSTLLSTSSDSTKYKEFFDGISNLKK